MLEIGRHKLRVPEGTTGPPDVPLWLNRLATDLSDVAKDNQGTLAARGVSTVPAPGIAGRYYASTNEQDGYPLATRRRVYRDFGTGYDELATVPVTPRMMAAFPRLQLHRNTAQAVPASALTKVSWTFENVDTGNGHAANSGDYVVPVTGLWLFYATLLWDEPEPGDKYAEIAVNDDPAARVSSAATSVVGVSQQVYVEVACTAGNVVNVKVQQETGSAADLSPLSEFAGRLIGP